MDPETQRVVLEELNSYELGFPISGRQIAEYHGIAFADIVTAALELERKARIGHYVISIVNEYGPGEVLDNIFISMTKLDEPQEKTPITLRLGGPQNFDAEQKAALSSLVEQFQARGYAVRVPRLITASVSLSMWDVLTVYLGGKAIDKVTDRALDKALDEIVGLIVRTTKDLYAMRRNKVERRQQTTIRVVNEDSNEVIVQIEIEDDDDPRPGKHPSD